MQFIFKNKLKLFQYRLLKRLGRVASSIWLRSFFWILSCFKKAQSRINFIKPLGWRFILAFLLILLIFAGKSPFEFFKNTIRAISGSSQTINLYANYAQPLKKSENYSSGWWQTEKIVGAPDLSPTAGMLDFSDSNSAFYAGGDYSVVVSNFRWLEADLKKEKVLISPKEEIKNASTTNENNTSQTEVKKDETLVVPESENATEPVTVPASTIVPESSNTAEPQVVDPKNQSVDVLPDNQNNQTETKIDELSGNNNGIAEPVQILSEEEATKLDNQSGKASQNESVPTVPVNIEKIPDVSLIDSLINVLTTPFVLAEEYLTQEIKSLSDLGDFKGAKLKLSIAMSDSQNNPSQFNLNQIKNIQSSGNEASEIETGATVDSASSSLIIDDHNTPPDASSETIISSSSEENSSNPNEVQVIENPEQNNGTVTPIENPAAAIEVEAEGKIPDTSLLQRFVEIARADDSQSKIIVSYSLGEKDESLNVASGTDNLVWQTLDTLAGSELSNALNGGYYSFDLSFVKSWADVEKLQIKLEGVLPDGEKIMLYLDSAWIEAKFDSNDQLKILERRARWEQALSLLSKNLVFNPADGGTLEFRYNKNEKRIWDTLSELMGLNNYWRNVEIEASLVDSEGKTTNVPLTMMFEEDGGFSIKLPEGRRMLKPGKYKIKFHIIDRSGSEEEVFDLSQSFSWGVLAFNTNRSAYQQNEEAYFQFGVLDENGETICNAKLEVAVTTPSGKVENLSTETDEYFSKIARSETCGPQTVSDIPDYSAHFKFGETGDYLVRIRAITDSGTKEISETIKVVENLNFKVERVGASRIFPKADYVMALSIESKADFKGDISEVVPNGFRIIGSNLKLLNNPERSPLGKAYKFSEETQGPEKKLTWQDVEFLAGDKLEIKYTYDAPDRSPEFYLLGELKLTQTSGENFMEYRRWQIASDTFRKRAKTVQFLGGIYNGGASSGQNTNVDYSFSSFTFRLAETGVAIKNAYIIFESQFEAYDASGGDYTGYRLAFDTCPTGSCAIDAFSGTNAVLADDSNILAYDETASNQARLLLDVTSEAQLAAYTGGGEEMTAQIGYQIKNGTSKTSIASAKAVLVVTYVYDFDTVNQTNTVTYPLASFAAGDSGSKISSVAGACTLNGTCPKYNYNMEIPEWPGLATSTNRVGVWFKMFDAPDVGATDLNTNLNIEYGGVTNNPASASFHHEGFNAGTQGNTPAMYFPNWTNSGYLENASQTLEYYVDANTNYAMGGEVSETYIASSSAPVKTRTVSFPLGVLGNGNSVALINKSVNVFFPENGAATGTVKIKKAWFRIISHNTSSGAFTTTVSSKIGTNATSTGYAYNYNGAGTVPMPSFTIIHIISSSTEIARLENARATSSQVVKLNVTQSSANYGGTSAELMITYTYSSEVGGYLDSLQLYAGQSSSNPATSTTFNSVTTSVLPETAGKTILAGGLYSSFLGSDSARAMQATVLLFDAGLSTTTPSCVPALRVTPDSINNFAEFYKDVTSSLNTDNEQTYNSCYTSDNSAWATDGARMNGILSYTYKWENSAPTGTFGVLQEKSNGSGTVDVALWAGDADGDDVRVKLEFATGTTCVFSTPGKPTLDENSANISATFGQPEISNAGTYQLGTSNSYIKTASGTNLVNFDWLAAANLGIVEGDYCLRMTVNDLITDMATSATSTVYVDTKAPTAPGALTFQSRTGTTMKLNFGATSTETNFREYKIFYKIANGTNPTESDSVFSSTSDINLFNKLFNDSSSTTIPGLIGSTTYSFAVWAYDSYGNKASSARADFTTNDAPTGIFNPVAQKTDGSGRADLSIKVDDLNHQDYLKAKIEYVLGADCIFSPGAKPTLDENPAFVLADWGLPTVLNSAEFQIGQPGAWILTSPGENDIDFDWLTRLDEGTANATYCLRLTVNDTFDNQLQSATTTLTLDNVNPTAPGALISGGIGTDNITLWYASTTPSSDTNPPPTNAYKIFYKQGTSGVTEGDTEIDAAALDAYNYSGATSTKKTGLLADTWYVFKIWSYDKYGNKSSSTETAIKTKATINNDSLSFTNAYTVGLDTNIAVAGAGIWNFRAVVSDINGWQAIASTTLRLADKTDDSAPYNDLSFYWDQTANQFYENGVDASNAVSVSPSSAANCSATQCILDFKLIFNKTFATTSKNYSAELMSINHSGMVVSDSYPNLYQVRFSIVNQMHYRFRNDDGGE